MPQSPMGNSTIATNFIATSHVVAGQRYALAVTRPSRLDAQAVASDPCPGQGFWTTAGSNAWAPWPTFGGFVHDWVFSVFVDRAVPATAPTGQRATALRRRKKRAQKRNCSKKRLKTCKKRRGGFRSRANPSDYCFGRKQ